MDHATATHLDAPQKTDRFSYDQMLDPKGNTAVYVLYAYARIAGVLRRAEYDVSTLSPSDLSLTEPSESWHSHLDRVEPSRCRKQKEPYSGGTPHASSSKLNHCQWSTLRNLQCR